MTLDGGRTDPPATTNAAGFYMVCSEVGSDAYRDLVAHSSGFIPVTRQVFGGWDYVVHLEMTRR